MAQDRAALLVMHRLPKGSGLSAGRSHQACSGKGGHQRQGNRLAHLPPLAGYSDGAGRGRRQDSSGTSETRDVEDHDRRLPAGRRDGETDGTWAGVCDLWTLDPRRRG
jgi:hypothetical protein